MAYLLDANIFIQAKNLHYGFDFCPAFWEWLLKQHEAGKVFSIEKVADELTAGNDELAEWTKKREDGFFAKPDAAVLPSLGVVSNWATTQQYEPAAVNTFLQVADYYLVAQALAAKHTIVSHEIAGNSRKRIKVPDACLSLGLKCMTPFEMLRHEKARFVLGRTA